MKDLTPSPVLSSFLVALVAVIVLTLVMLTAPAYAGKHPYPELTDEIDNAILRILNKHACQLVMIAAILGWAWLPGPTPG